MKSVIDEIDIDILKNRVLECIKCVKDINGKSVYIGQFLKAINDLPINGKLEDVAKNLNMSKYSVKQEYYYEGIVKNNSNKYYSTEEIVDSLQGENSISVIAKKYNIPLNIVKKIYKLWNEE